MSIFAILALIAAGMFIATTVLITFAWLRNKLNLSATKKNVSKVFIGTLRNMALECDNQTNLREINNLSQKYTHTYVELDENGNPVNNVELIKNKDQNLDDEVAELLGKNGKVVVNV